jgi:hypothetical protein
MNENLYQLLSCLLWLSFAAFVCNLISQFFHRAYSRRQEIKLENIRNEHELKRWQENEKHLKLKELEIINKFELEKLKIERLYG